VVVQVEDSALADVDEEADVLATSVVEEIKVSFVARLVE
jgi:hypothetical protein